MVFKDLINAHVAVINWIVWNRTEGTPYSSKIFGFNTKAQKKHISHVSNTLSFTIKKNIWIVATFKRENQYKSSALSFLVHSL